MSTGLKKKADLILSREQRMARAIALKAIRPKPFSVWEVMIPVIFIMGYMKAKADREVFTQNILFTKKLALELENFGRKLAKAEVPHLASKIGASPMVRKSW